MSGLKWVASIICFVLCWAGSSTAQVKKTYLEQMHDDGMVRPYAPPADHAKYVERLPAELVPTLAANPAALEAWQDDRFGIFLHWDHSSLSSASMSWGRGGAKPHHSKDGKASKISEEDYNNLAYQFNPVEFDADEWAAVFAASGAKYVVFTAKHHAGFSMFDTAVSDFDIMASPFGRDVCKELSDALHKRGLKVGWYFSQPDWYEPRYREELPSKTFNEEFLFPQIRELLTNYGKIDILWFDGLGKHPDTWDSPRMLKMARELQPDLIVNHRFASRPYRMGDYDGPENEIGRFQVNRPWETCAVVGGKWGYGGKDTPMTLRDCIVSLVRCAGNGGNLLLNTGPHPDGNLSPLHVERYLGMGEWLKLNGESIYATRGGPYMPGAWGSATHSKDGKTVYLHVMGKVAGETLSLPALPVNILKARCLDGSPVHVEQRDGQLVVAAPKDNPDAVDIVIALELEGSVCDITPIETVGELVTAGGVATSSSQGKEPPSVVVASNVLEFHEGTFVKSSWSPAKSDKAPWIQIDFTGKKDVQSLEIQQGKIGKAVNPDQTYVVEANVDGQWKELYRNNKLFIDNGIILAEPVTCTALRVTFEASAPTINMINAFGPIGQPE